MSPAPKPGRREAICEAVFELLGEVGYDRMSMDAVAARARASKATIYRGWPTKPDLVMDAFEHRFGGSFEPQDTGTLRGDLMALLTAACQVVNSPDGDVMTGLLTAVTRNPELAETFRRCVYDAKQSAFVTIVRRAVERGELPEGATSDLLQEVLQAMVLNRTMRQEGPLDESFVHRVVDRVLLPVLRQPI
ncbi:TetR/AcrR family transcriptional regulator [Dactylosporangium sp. NPDC050688]|uniref:TetR/AcrR family transcriptional regulator n=1 Tax=Dactylosporangium sp. NPDC050688 TaxID=3157217 RepID=UPI0033C9CEC2